MNYVERLDSALENAVKKCVGALDRFGLLFSGGLDSSLLAKMCIDMGKSPVLVSVFMAGSKDEAYVREAAGFFDLEFIVKEISEKDVGEHAKKVAMAASTQNTLDISIGVPIYAALVAASKAGIESVMVGQGADELFGGYYRYLGMDKKKLEEALKKDVETVNIARDISIGEACGVKLLVPYLDEKLVSVGLRIPVDWKIRNGTRKFILREIAKKRGLPKTIWAREKKAIQYSTGVDKIVRKVLKHV
jgi:asparagine synthase (glutamine-hydrolysing)